MTYEIKNQEKTVWKRAFAFPDSLFLKDTMRNLCIMLQKDGKLWSLREWGSGFYYLFIKPGVLRRIFIPWLRFLRKDFHPWQHDNRYLINAWEQEQAAADIPGAE